MSFETIEQVLKDITKRYGEGVVQSGVNIKERTKFSLGSPGLDFCTYNSIPEGIFIELTGSEGSGKTLLSYLIAADYSRKELKKPIEEQRQILFVDAEGTADPYWAYVATKYDMNAQDIKTIYITPTGQSAEQIFDMVREFAQTGKIGLIIFDSLTAISPQQVNDESFEKKDMGGLAKPLADFVKRCTGLFNKNKTTFIGINGTIQNISGYGPNETAPGGTYWKRACSLRLKVKRGAFFDEEGNELKATAENPAGHIIETALLKSKFCRSDRKLGRCHLDYKRGIDILSDTIEVATFLGFIDNSVQGTFKFIDVNTGEILLDENNEPIKIRGKKNLKPYLEEHPTLWRQIYNKVYEVISNVEDSNIKSFEEILNIDINERLGITEDTDLDTLNM